MTNSISSIKPFASGHTRALGVTIVLAVIILLDLVAILGVYNLIDLLSRAMNDPVRYQYVLLWEVENSVDTLEALGGLEVMTFLVLSVLFFMWIHRAHRNLPALVARNLRFSPGWAVGWFFVPIMNLIRPYEVIEEIWKASDPNVDISDGSSWQNASTSPVIGLWWVLWLISGFIGHVLFRMSSWAEPETLDGVMTMCWVMVGYIIFSIVPVVLLILVIRAIDIRQEEKSRRVATLDISLGENEGI